MTEKSYEEKRKEFCNQTFRQMMIYTLGNNCCNCGSDENIEYHHIVPLKLGGTNNISNIVPLCQKCHYAAHRGRHIDEYKVVRRAGRKRKEMPDNCEDIIKRYVYGEIGKQECQRELGIGSGAKNSHAINRNQTYREYLKQNGIKSHRNNIDFISGRGVLVSSCVRAKVEFEDGRIFYRKHDGTEEWVCQHSIA